MDSIKVTYELRRHDSTHFHGWIVWECCEGFENEYFSSTSYEEAHAIYEDLHPEVLQTPGHPIWMYYIQNRVLQFPET